MSAPEAPHVTAAVVNWNGKSLLPACLASLRAQTGVRLEVLLVDNASTDGSVEWVRREFPEVRILQNRENRGYGAGLNQAIDAMAGRFLLALNTDIRLEPDCARQLASGILAHSGERCGYAMGKVRLMQADGVATDRLYSTGHLFVRSRLVYNRGAGQVDRGQFDREEFIPGANGACVMIRHEALEDLRAGYGVFDDLFFLYGNDADFDWLAALRGWKCLYRPQALCWHIGEASSRVTERGFDARYVNVRFLLMLKNDRPLDVLLDLAHIARGNAKDLLPKLLRHPSLALTGPLDLLWMAPKALRRRWESRRLRAAPRVKPREWFRWSSRLLRESRSDG